MVLSDVLRCALHNIVCPFWFWPWYCLTFFDVLKNNVLRKTHRRTSDNTMAKTNKDIQCYTKNIAERQTIPWPKPTRTNRWFWPWYCLTFFDVLCIAVFVLVGFGHGIVWRSSMCFVRRTSDNTMAKTNKDKQCYTKHIEERQTIPWPKPTRKTMLYKTHRRTSVVMHCLSLLVLAMVLSDVLRCILYNIVCPCWFWS
jgi:hypothetical protein